MDMPVHPSAQRDTLGAESVAALWPQTGLRSFLTDSPARQGRGGRNLAPPPVAADRDCPSKRNRLKQLRLFCYAALTGSITKAAERASVTQPSVSQQVRALERELRLDLFERRGPRITLTQAGRYLYEISMPLVESMDNLHAVFHERFSRSISGEVRIAAGPSTAGFLLPRYLKQFHERHPRVRLSVKNVFSQDALKLLREHAVDFAVGTMDVVPDDLQHRLMLTSDIMLATPEDHPLARHESVSTKEIEKYPMIVPPSGSYTRHLWDFYARQYGVKLNALVEVDGWWIIKRFVQNGLGISVLPSLCVGKGDRISLIPFVQPFPKLSHGLITHRHMLLSAAARQFILMMDPDHPAAI